MSTIKVANVQHTSNSNDSISIASDSSVALKHSGNAKLTTTASGVNVTGSCTATSFTGDGANLTNLPVDLTQLNANNLTSGTIPASIFPATLPAVSGANLTGISAGALQHVSDHVVPAGTTVAQFEITNIPADTKYLLRGILSFSSYGGHLNIYPHIYDSSTLQQFNWSGQSSSLDTYTHYVGGYSASQMSNAWQVYEGGNYYSRAYFEMTFNTTARPIAQTKLFAETHPNALCHGNHRDSTNMDVRKINGFTFYNNWGYNFDENTKLSLYKYSNY